MSVLLGRVFFSGKAIINFFAILCLYFPILTISLISYLVIYLYKASVAKEWFPRNVFQNLRLRLMVHSWRYEFTVSKFALFIWLSGLSVCLQTKWLWVRILLLSLKLQLWRLLRARSFLAFRQTIEWSFTLKLVRDMIITYSHKNMFHGVRTLHLDTLNKRWFLGILQDAAL